MVVIKSMGKKVNKRSNLNIGVLLGSALSYYTTELIEGLYQAAKDYDVNIMFFLGAQEKQDDEVDFGWEILKDFDYQVNTVYDYAQISGVDALIISYGTIGSFLDNDKEKFLSKFSDFPYIILEEEGEENYIINDNYSGMRAVVEHLIQVHKYNKIAYLSGPVGNLDAIQRKQAYIDVMNENLLPIPDGYIENGDFSRFSGWRFDRILERHPDIEAVVCANDEMALGVYERCKVKGIKIGEEIAITGFDSCTLVQNLEPSLTTVSQNTYDMGYCALKEAIKLCNDGKKVEVRMPTSLIVQESCGCFKDHKKEDVFRYSRKYIVENMDAVVADIVDSCILNHENGELKAEVVYCVKELMVFCVSIFDTECEVKDEKEGREYLNVLMNRFVSQKYGEMISSKSFLGIMQKVLSDLLSENEDVKRKNIALPLFMEAQEYVYAKLLRRNEEELQEYKDNLAIGSFLERKLIEYIHDEKQVYLRCLNQLKMNGVLSAFICLHEEPIRYRKYSAWNCPDNVYVSAMFKEDTLIAFEEKERMLLNAKNSIVNMLGENRGQGYIVLPLFAGELQYGFLVCEAEPSDIPSVYVYSLTLGSILRFMFLSKQEKRIQKKLEASMRLLQEKNKVLGFISAYDELTGMLNRRGFGEKAFEFTQNHQGKKAYFVFADLDHLKEINDKFGHAEGDYAITQCARVLRAYCGENDIAGRMGGDEFMMMIVSDEENFEENFKKNVKKTFDELNATSNKPFYVEASIGVKPFVGDSEFELSTVLQQADKLMYESKKSRRETISRVD